MRYIPTSPDERISMLREIGCERIEDLFDQVPESLRVDRPIGIGRPMSEPELVEFFNRLASKNGTGKQFFLGAGAYSHHIPVIIDSLISRSEFLTAYTPYQPELSQGTLQYIFEFQTMVSQLTGMDVANASLYDGSTALAEAVLMAERVTRRSKVVASTAVHPQYLEVVKTYVQHAGIDLELADFDQKTGQSAAALAAAVDDQTAALVVQSPNFFGCI